MSTELNPPNPFPIRKKGDRWEVVFIDQGGVEDYILCDTEEHAVAVANARPFNAAFETRQKCDPDAVQLSIDALDHYGLSTTKIYRRLKFLLEDMAEGVI